MSPVRGVIFDVGGTLGTVNREWDEIVADGARALVDPVLLSATTGIRKPQPDAYQALLDLWDIPGYEAVMVGDRIEEDIRGALEAEMWAVLTNMVAQPVNECLLRRFPPDATITRLPDIVPIIEAWDEE